MTGRNFQRRITGNAHSFEENFCMMLILTARVQDYGNYIAADQSTAGLSETPSIAMGDEAGTYMQRTM